MSFTWVTIRPGRSTSADLVQSRFTQIGPRSVSELESVLTLISSCKKLHKVVMNLKVKQFDKHQQCKSNFCCYATDNLSITMLYSLFLSYIFFG